MSSQVVIVGGGVIGSSIAYFLRASNPTVSVTVIERDPSYAKSSSALSAASIRQQFSTPLSIQMSLYGIDFLRNIGDLLEVDGNQPAIDLHEGGYLCWSGYYEYNVLDHNAIIAYHPDIENCVFANGYSGHGLQQGPATGRNVSELILNGEYTTLDLSSLSWDGILENRPIVERNVV